ncbi:MAG: restriction endonuclease subunit M, partial [Bacteroidetes bacterium]|nr:restriction endonuclease subunit M [Bacteroidota bacterium]
MFLDLYKEDNLLKKFEEIHNYIYANDGLSSQQTLEEIIKILFIKIYDENNNINKFQISSDELNQIKHINTAESFKKRIINLFDK